MGDQRVKSDLEGAPRRAFIRRVLNDLHALERIVDEGLIEKGVRRVGAEQEVFLVDRDWRPAPAAMKLLPRIDDPRFTTELAQFNLEMNLDPLVFEGSCLSLLEHQLQELVGSLRSLAAEYGVEVVLTGILPTLRKSDMSLDNMTPMPRYRALNDAMTALRGGAAYELYIKGLDELLIKHDSVMLEACNSSFQVHFQVDAEEFANLYNIAQVAVGPVLAAAVNSPLLFGRQLWRETRIALFQQSVDTRSSTEFLRERSPRVTFGQRWIESILDLFQEDLSRFRTLVSDNTGEDPIAALDAGEVPKLKALCAHNSTVYRWNRACYGLTDGKPHLRIENRVLPSGPTVIDEVANAAFWFGLISALSSKYEDITQLIAFEDARMNFRSAARLGLAAEYVWLNGQSMPAVNLICDRLLPLAHEGLERRGIDASDAARYLTVIDERVSSGRTGSNWMISSLADMRGQGNLSERLVALTAAMVDRQKSGMPVSEWTPAQLAESGGWQHSFVRVDQYMTTDLITVSEDESLDLVAGMMEWKRIRHIPVEDAKHCLVGLISYRSLLKLMARGVLSHARKEYSASDIMHPDPITIAPDAPTLQAIELMREHRISCLPVVSDGKLVGIVTERDLMIVAGELMERQLRD